MNGIVDMIARGWENFLARSDGQFNLRFIIQPAMAALIAVRAGVRDAKVGRQPYLWKILTVPGSHPELLRGSWKDIRIPLLMGAVIDLIYQVVTQRWVYPLELLFTVTLLALVPYVLVRGPANRIARFFVRNDGAASPPKANPPAPRSSPDSTSTTQPQPPQP